MDDTYIVVREDHADRALQLVKDVFQRNVLSSGLRLKLEKTRVCDPRTFRASGVNVLGTHIGGGATEFLDSKLEEWKKTVSRVQELPYQDANLLLRTSVLPHLGHLYRTLAVPEDAWKEADQALDDVVRGWLSRFDLGQWDHRLTSLPLRLGGLGLPRPSTIASAAFTASQDESYRMLERLEHTMILPQPPEKSSSQRARTQEIWTGQLSDVMKDLQPDERRVFEDNSSTVGTKWLHAFPADSTLTFSDGDFAAAIAHRLLLQGKHCRCCRQPVADFGHPFHCPSTRGLRLSRHELVKLALRGL